MTQYSNNFNEVPSLTDNTEPRIVVGGEINTEEEIPVSLGNMNGSLIEKLKAGEYDVGVINLLDYLGDFALTQGGSAERAPKIKEFTLHVEGEMVRSALYAITRRDWYTIEMQGGGVIYGHNQLDSGPEVPFLPCYVPEDAKPLQSIYDIEEEKRVLVGGEWYLKSDVKVFESDEEFKTYLNQNAPNVVKAQGKTRSSRRALNYKNVSSGGGQLTLDANANPSNGFATELLEDVLANKVYVPEPDGNVSTKFDVKEGTVGLVSAKV